MPPGHKQAHLQDYEIRVDYKRKSPICPPLLLLSRAALALSFSFLACARGVFSTCATLLFRRLRKYRGWWDGRVLLDGALRTEPYRRSVMGKKVE